MSCAFVVFVASMSCAQPLTLDVPTPLGPGEGRAAVRTALVLEREAEALDGAPAGWRRFGAAALRAGAAMGEGGSPLVVLGRTVANKRRAFDGLVRSDGVDGFAARLAGAGLDRLAADVASGAHADARAIERALRDALSPIVDGGPRPPDRAGWFLKEPIGPIDDNFLDGVLDGVLVGVGLDPDGAAAVRTTDGTLRRAEGVHSLRRGARLTRSRLARAAGLLHDPPAWLSDAALQKYADVLADAAAGVTDPGRRIASLETLARLGLVSRAARALDGVAPDPTRRDIRDARGDFDRFVRTVGARSDPERARMLLRGLRLLDLSVYSDADERMVRHLRPAMLAFRREALRSSGRLLAQIEALFEGDSPASDPAAISLLLGQQGALDAMDSLIALDRVLADPERSYNRRPLIRREHEDVGERLLELAGAIDPRESDISGGAAAVALEEIRALADVMGRLTPMPGEAVLRRAGAGAGDGAGDPRAARVRELLGGSSGRLADAMARARSAWVGAWAAGGPERERSRLRGRIDLLERLGRAVEALAWAEPAGHAQAWPGWELSRPTFDALVLPFARELRDTTLAVVRGDGDAGERVAALEELHAGAVLAGVLERELALAMDVVEAMDGGSFASVHELGLGPPDPIAAWGAGARARLASVCRYAEELALPDRPGEAEIDRERLRALIGVRARTAIGDVIGAASWR